MLKIQAWHKMRHVRKRYIQLLQYEKAYTSVKWTHETGKEVSLVGDFTAPAWKVVLRMEYCSLRRIFVKYLANLKEGEEYCYSFIVDGRKLPHQDTLTVGRSHALGEMKINTLSSSRTSKGEDRSAVPTPAQKPVEAPPLPPPPKESEPKSRPEIKLEPTFALPLPTVVPQSVPVPVVVQAPFVPELKSEDKSEDDDEDKDYIPPISVEPRQPALATMEEAAKRVETIMEYRTPTTEPENKSDKTSSFNRSGRWNPEEEFASFPISKRETEAPYSEREERPQTEDKKKPEVLPQETGQAANERKTSEKKAELGSEGTTTPEETEAQQRQRETIEKDRVSGGGTGINFEMAYDYIPDDYYS